MDMPGDRVTYREYISEYPKLNDLFGFFYCDIEISDNYLGLLPVRDRGLLIFPNGKWSGWYFSEQLKYASLNGYKIRVLKGYEFNKVENVFKSYIYSLFDLKKNHLNITVRETAKLLLNSFLGRFGLDINRNTIDLVTEDQDNLISIYRQRIAGKKSMMNIHY